MSWPRDPGPTGSLALAVFHDWEPERLFLIVTLFADESGTHGDSPVTVMGGYVGKLGQWYEFDRKWRRAITRRGLSYMHMKEVLHREGDFKNLSNDEHIALGLELEKIGKKHLLFGCTTCVTEEAYRSVYAAGEKPKKIPLDTKYGLCFRLLLGLTARKVYDALGRDDLQLNVVLEDGAKNVGDVKRIWKLFRTDAEPELARMAGTLTFAAKKDFPGLQYADGIASSVYFFERDDEAYGLYHPENAADMSLKAASKRAPAHSPPVFRVEGVPPLLLQMREHIFAKIEARRQFGQQKPKPSAEQSS